MTLQRFPDLAEPVVTGPAGTVFRAFERTTEAVALPHRLLLDRQPDGAPMLQVALVRGSGSPTATGGRLSVGLTVDTDFAAVAGDSRLIAPHVEHAVLRVTGPEGFAVTTVAGPETAGRAYLDAELGPAAAVLAKRLTEGGRSAIEATLRMLVRAVATRHPVAYEFDSRVLAERLGSADFSVERLAEIVEAVASTVTGDREATDPAERRRALALRLLDRLAEPAPTVEPLYRLRPLAAGTERIDLAEPGAVFVDVVVDLDTVAAEAAIAAAGPDRLVRRVDLPTLPTGRIPLSLRANLVFPIPGLVTLIADVRVPPKPPLRPQPASVSAELARPDGTASVVLSLAPGEAISGEARLRALIDIGDGVEEITGPWRPVTSDTVLLGPDAFPLPLTVIRLSSGLTSQATVDVVTAKGARLAALDARTPTAAVAVPASPPKLVVRPSGSGHPIEIPVEPRARVDLDPATLPGFGAHQAKLDFAGAAAPVTVRWRAEGTPESVARQVTLGPKPTRAVIRWVATSPFEPGILWRTNGPWSEPVAPQDGLVIAIPGDPEPVVVEVDGVELRSDPGTPGRWSYEPVGPTVELARDGSPQLSIVEAEGMGFLQLTARLDLPEGTRARLLSELRRHVDATEVRAVPVAVQAIGLQVREAEAWTTIADGRGSGVPPWTSALSASLRADRLSALKAAVEGTRGKARLHARFTLPSAHVVDTTTDLADLLGSA
ncbi:hypothetical protein GCM10022247_72620 [Allokutzneria multivorans]|uniref:Uncharacterized protein n=1 Tax=Allokutzneria multivorans TaxID=1142134 RepID=A0ABP7U5E7_9PSEU